MSMNFNDEVEQNKFFTLPLNDKMLIQMTDREKKLRTMKESIAKLEESLDLYD